MEIFFCTAPKSATRRVIARACLDRWLGCQGIVHVVKPWGGYHEFQKNRRVYADSVAQDPWYVLTDDDCLVDPRLVPQAIGLAQRYPEFGILSFLPDNAKINPWRPNGKVPYEDPTVFEHHDVGGVRVIQKGLLRGWPTHPENEKGYDRAHCRALRASGYKVGYFKNFKMVHLGEGFSEVW